MCRLVRGKASRGAAVALLAMAGSQPKADTPVVLELLLALDCLRITEKLRRELQPLES